MNQAHNNIKLQSQRGLSLIELMVSIVIGLFLVLGATTLYVNTRKSADVDDSIARLQETARYAMSVIETDVRMANYFGDTKDGSSVKNKLSNTTESAAIQGVVHAVSSAIKCGADYAIDVADYIQATNASYGLPVSTCGPKSGAVATADTLTVRRAETPVVAKDNNKIQLCSNQLETSIIAGSTLDCPATSEIHDLLTHTYYVDKQSDQSTSIPSLRRWTLIAGPDIEDDEIVAGIEDMQIQLGWAPPDSTQVPTSDAVVYLQPDNALVGQTGSQIVSVRIWLLVRSEDPDYGFTDTRTYSYAARTGTSTTADLEDTAHATDVYAPNDHYHRLLVSKTIFVRNIVGT